MKAVLIAAGLTLAACGGGSTAATPSDSLSPATCALLQQPASPVAGPDIGTLGAALSFWIGHGSADVIVYMNPDASVEDVASTRQLIDDDDRVASYVFLDHEAAFSEFQSIFADEPSVATSLTESDTPESFKVVMRSSADIESFASEAQSASSVFRVVTPIEEVQKSIVAASTTVQPQLDRLRRAGGTNSLFELIDANKRIFAAFATDQHARLVGDGGVFTRDEVDHLQALAAKLRSEIQRDCAETGSS